MLVGQGSAASTVAKWAGLARDLHLTFWGVLIIVGVTLALSVFVPQATKEHSAPT